MSMEELAGKIHISRQTLSAIINGTWKEKRISQATYQRTMTLIDQLGYVPHSSARHLSKRKKDTIGLIYHGNFFSHISKAIQYLNSYLYKEQIPVSLKMTSSLALKESVKELLGERIRKIIIINTFKDLADRIVEENITPYLQKVPTIIYNYHFDYEKDKEYQNILLQHGISLIGFSRLKIYTEFFKNIQKNHFTTLFIEKDIYNRLKNCDAEEVLFSQFSTVHSYEQPDREEMEFNEFLVGESLGKKLLPLLTSGEKTVIVTDSDMVAEGLADFLVKNGVEIPGETGLLGFDNLNASGYFRIPLTTIHVPVKEMIENLVWLLKNKNDTEAKAYISDSKIIYRESLVLE